MKHEFLDHHREGNSLVHLFDPRLKLLMMMVFIIMVVTVSYERKQWLLFYLVIPIAFAGLSRISILHFLSKLFKLYPMIFLITILIPFFPLPNETPRQFFGIAISISGLQKFFLINAKSILVLFISIVLTITTDFMMLLKGLEKLRVPPIMTAIVSFMYRFIFLLIDEVERMLMAYQSRYLRLSLGKRLKIIANMIGMLFIRTYERGERIYLAMESRGFQGTIHTLNDLRWKKTDTIAAVIFLSILLVPLLSIPF
ncbi:MAG: cobalt ECF transporter T component CbiQ [Caldithrix sp. RBG_13_44_9]|nr:MAG: cobalt ECF transporter T component CbiQ [Caldithrix sp. RBG_13_44_9]